MRAFALIIVLLFIIGAFFVFADPAPNTTPTTTDPETSATGTVSTYFKEEFTKRAVADIGQPIEGFDAGLLIQAYPGLSPQDFAGVVTREGRYEISPSDELIFVRDESKMISTAERAISDEGYATLLANLAFRLETSSTTKEAVDTIIDRVDTAEQIETRTGETGDALGIRITPLDVLEDSRCAIDVTCIQAGTVRVRATVASVGGSSSHEFTLNEASDIDGQMITLVSVSPEAQSTIDLQNEDYIFRFSVTKK